MNAGLSSIKRYITSYRKTTENVSRESGTVPNSQAGVAGSQNTADNPELAATKLKHEITEKLGNILKSDGFSKLVKDSVKAQMSIKPEDVAKPGKIDELYERIQRTSASA